MEHWGAAFASAQVRDEPTQQQRWDEVLKSFFEFSASPVPPKEAPRGFRRVLRWQLEVLSLLLGSDTVIFQSDAQGCASLDTSKSADGYHAPGISVRLHEANSAATSLVCLDYWLDNVMANAGEVALCLHTDGVVQGYRLLRTDALPSPGALGEGFSPAAVTQRAVSVLRFLRYP